MQDKVKVEARNIAMSYGKTQVLRDIDLVIEPGEFFALLGPSGSGKSTLLRLIAGFNQAQSGQLLIGGEDISRVPPWQRNVGMVFQNYALWPHMSVWENVAFGLQERRLPKSVIGQKVAATLALVNLEDYARRRPNQLSGGQQQRVALARTIAIEPKVLLLDEPLSNLDAKLRVHMREELRTLQRKLGITTIFVTHDQEEAMTTADRIAVMDQGVLQQIGTPLELFDNPANRFVANFVGTINLLPCRLRKASRDMVSLVSSSLGEIELPRLPHAPEAGDVEICFRPHAVTVCVADSVRDHEHVWLQGTVSGVEFLGEFVRYRIRVGSTEIIADQTHHAGTTPFTPESTVNLGIPRCEIRFISN
ncbi:MAG: ABC transporter ATP-binding protein [Betaproteobacteria bacterium CG2_30_68_42]|nr:MAG: ABC transporter ATP-binding protein [Betaproteobacteria bacterium CG2_30_68_42]PJA56477.1 MAG: polyamine ABC transporter ATP-binding protein [Rhodocyclales bacterium CG_4_9_14_3_um_filter_68_10]